MMNESKEDKIIINSKAALLKFSTDDNTDDNTIFGEYDKLLKNYIKLNKQLKRMMKLGDSSSKNSREKNKKTVSIARNKILNSITKSRKIKETLPLGDPADKKQIVGLTKLLKISMDKVERLEKRVSRTKNNTKDVGIDSDLEKYT